MRVRRDDLVEPALSYVTLGALFEVHNELGPGHLERVYQQAITKALEARSIAFQQQVMVPVQFRGTQCAKHFLDFLIEGRVIVEIKRTPRFARRDLHQTIGYLKALNVQLALLVCFGSDELFYRRIINTR